MMGLYSSGEWRGYRKGWLAYIRKEKIMLSINTTFQVINNLSGLNFTEGDPYAKVVTNHSSELTFLGKTSTRGFLLAPPLPSKTTASKLVFTSVKSPDFHSLSCSKGITFC